ncbi:MAG TPA: hypothetical protein VF362_02790 [Demequinaceae bacterium]
MEIRPSALKHGVRADDIRHAYQNAIRYVEFEYRGETRLLVIGADSAGRLLELVVVPSPETSRIIHADLLRPKFRAYVR